MSEDDLALFGEAGKRVERVEWGNRWPATTLHGLRSRGQVDPAGDEEHAWLRAEHPLWGPEGRIYPEVVTRVVVTHTTPWVRQDQDADQ